MKRLSKVLILALTINLLVNGQYTWNDQDNWTGDCNAGSSLEQSPIDIITGSVVIDEDINLTGEY